MSLPQVENRYYVYMWLREDNTPYYIGKGQRKRAFRKGSPEDQTKIWILDSGLTEKEAYDFEKFTIASWKDEYSLENKTPGGQGGWAKDANRRKRKFIWITDGKASKLHLKEQTIPFGWKKGRIQPMSDEEIAKMAKKVSNTTKGKKKESISFWYTNGTENIKVRENDLPPEGFKRGRTVGKRGPYNTTKRS